MRKLSYEENKITIKQIFKDNYEEFWKKNKEKYPKKCYYVYNMNICIKGP